MSETPNEEAQVRENTENEPVGSENIELVQHITRTDELDIQEEEVGEQSEEQNIISEKLEREFRRTETEE